MPVRLGVNIAALQVQRRLAENSDRLGDVFQRLSSGQRINRASDDAAGLAVSSTLNAQARVLGQAVRNIGDGVSMLNVAEAALKELGSIITRQMELAEQSANGIYSLAQRKAMNAEANALSDEYNRIIQSTRFNGRALLDGSLSSLSLQVGQNSGDTLRLDVGSALARTVGTGNFSAAATFAATDVTVADLNADGAQDLIYSDGTSGSVRLGNGNGAFRAVQSFDHGGHDTNNVAHISTGDFNGDGLKDIVILNSANAVPAADRLTIMLGNGNGTFAAGCSFGTSINDLTYSTVSDFNGDGHQDIAVGGNSGPLSVLFGNGNGTFSSPKTGLPTGYGVIAADMNNDGRNEIVSTNGNEIWVTCVGHNGSLQASRYAGYGNQIGLTAADFNLDGFLDVAAANLQAGAGQRGVNIYFGKGDGTLQAAVSIATAYTTGALSVTAGDMNNDGISDLAISYASVGRKEMLLGKGDGTFTQATAGTYPCSAWGTFLADLNGDEVLDLAAARTFGFLLTAETDQTALTKRLNLLTQTSAREELGYLNESLDRINGELGSIGAFQSRLHSAFTSLTVMQENMRAAESRIRDADFADEAAKQVRLQILQQTGAAVLAQANQQGLLALSLLQ